MKTLIALSLLLGGGTGVAAITTETEAETTIKEKIFGMRDSLRRHGIRVGIETIQEDGFPLPSEDYLNSLSEEQQDALLNFVNTVNETYDFSNMTEDEIKDVLKDVLPEFKDLLTEYGIEGYREAVVNDYIIQDLRENGFTLPEWQFLEELTEDQAMELQTYVDTLNATYDIPNMTDEELLEAHDIAKEGLREMLDEYDYTPRTRARQRVLDTVIVDGEFTLPEDRIENLDEEAQAAVLAFIDEVNETYDFESMTDEEIVDALKEIGVEMKDLLEDYGVNFPARDGQNQQGLRDRIREAYKNRQQSKRQEQTETEDPTDEVEQ